MAGFEFVFAVTIVQWLGETDSGSAEEQPVEG